MTDRYRKLAAYNSWANARLYEAAAAIPEADRRADRGAIFKSLHGTLNHLLVGDRIWMRRFTGEGEAPARLDTILFEDFADLREARVGEDKRIEAYVENLDDEALSGSLSYKTVVNPARVEQRLSEALDHFFNHQTHHRGQAHCLLTAIAGDAPSFDLVVLQRERGWARKIGQ
jgi:uncharacterized damage-inducible protein DinB